MPWVLSLALIIAVPLVGIYFYDIKLLLNSVEVVFGWNRNKTRRWILLGTLFLNLLPFAALSTWFAGGREAMTVFSGDVPLVDYLFTYPFWVSLVVVVQFFLFLALWEILKLLAFPWYRKQKARWNLLEKRYVLVAFLGTGAYCTSTIYTDTWVVRIREKEIKLPKQFAGLDGLRIAQCSDIHGDGRTTPGRIQYFVDKVNSLHPDFIFFAGDVVSSGDKYIESTTKLFHGFDARLGKIAAVGDHDIFTNKTAVIDGLKRSGFRVVEDSTIHYSINATDLSITDVTYTYRQRPTYCDFQHASEDAGGSYKILLVHQPAEALVQFASVQAYHLFIAGHSHGGVLAFGIPGIYLWAPSRIETKFFSGFFQVGQMFVSVTNGFGHTLAPIRYQAPVEITLLRLVRGPV